MREASTSPNPFDQACRYLVKMDPQGVIGFLTGMGPQQFTFEKWIDARRARFPREPDRTCDTVARITNHERGDEPWVSITEFQLDADPLMSGRMMGYGGAFWLEYKSSKEAGDRYRLGFIVVNLRGRGHASLDMQWESAGFGMTMTVHEWNLEFEDAIATMDRIEAGTAPLAILPWIPVMRHGSEIGTIERWKRLAEREPDLLKRRDYGGLVVVFAEVTKCQDVWKEALKEWNVVRSVVVDEWFAIRETELLVDLLQTKFGMLPTELTTQIHSVQDLPRIRELLHEVVRVPTLEEWRNRFTTLFPRVSSGSGT